MPERWQFGWIATGLCVGWAAGSAMDVRKYGGRWAPWLLIAGMLAVLGVLRGMRWWLRRGDTRQPGWLWLLGLWVLMVAAQLVIYPRAQQRLPAYRNDSEDALSLASGALLHGHFPYAARTFLGAPITPMPGAVMLALPFRAINRVRWQGLFWEAILILFAQRYFRTRAAALVFLLLVFADLHTFLNLAVGADYPVNFIYVAVTVAWWLGAVRCDLRRWAATFLLGVALSSRLSYLIVFPGLLWVYWQQSLGAARALLRVAQPLAVTLVVTLPFYLYSPGRFSPLHVVDRLSFLDTRTAHRVMLVLVVATLAIVATATLVRLTVSRLFLLAGLACVVLLGVPGLLACLQRSFDVPSLTLLGYVDAAVFFFSLWALDTLEASALSRALLPQMKAAP